MLGKFQDEEKKQIFFNFQLFFIKRDNPIDQ